MTQTGKEAIVGDIRSSIEAAVKYLSEHPDEARYTDPAATATMQDGLRFHVTGAGGEEIVTDMPAAVGGSGSAPSPGWLFRAAVASCSASLIAMEAARAGVRVSRLDVAVDSESDDRGILGMEPSVPAGPLSVRIHVQIEAEGVEPSALEGVARRGIGRCPVVDGVRRAVETTIELESS